MVVDINHNNTVPNEIKISTVLQKSLKKQYNYLKDNWKDIYENNSKLIYWEYEYLNNITTEIYSKDFYIDPERSPMDWFWRNMWVYNMIDWVKDYVRKVVEKWYKRRYRLRDSIMKNNWFLYQDKIPIDYMNLFWELNLSDYRWSISRTTKFDIVSLLKEGLDNNDTVDTIATKINGLDWKLFSPARAKLIAKTEVGRAYEYWNYIPAKQLNSIGKPIVKYWSTVRDERVRPSHTDNEMQGWVKFDTEYFATWTQISWTEINCRCTMLYEIEK